MINRMTSIKNSENIDDDVFWLFRVSFMYFSLIGCATVWIVGWPISLLTNRSEIVDEKLLAPFLRTKPINEQNVIYTNNKL